MNNLKILTLTGPSGAGKTTVARILIEQYGYEMVTSTTTREPRPTDLPGEYRHVTPEEFEQLEIDAAFLWTVEVAGQQYGTESSIVLRSFLSPAVKIMILTSEGVINLHTCLRSAELISVYLVPPDEEELRRRLHERGDSPEQIAKRMEDSREWPQQFNALKKAVPSLVWLLQQPPEILVMSIDVLCNT